MWFFKKRENPESSVYLQNINNNLKESFQRIKKDMQATKNWLSYFKDRESDHENRLKNIESRIEEIGEVLTYMQEAQEVKTTKRQDRVVITDEEEYEESEESPKILNDLTDTQKAMFLRLGTLLYESSQEWITAKALLASVIEGIT